MAIRQLDVPAIHGAAMQAQGQQMQNSLYRQQSELTQKKLADYGKPTRAEQFANIKELAFAVEKSDTLEKFEASKAYLNRVTNSDYFSRFRFEDRDMILAGLNKEIADYGTPMPALDKDGNPTLVQPSKRGGVRPVKDYTPVPKKPLVEVNLPGQPQIGTIPPGYEAIQDKKTKAWSMRMIAGGPAAAEAAAAARAGEAKEKLESAKSDLVVEDLDRSINMVKEANFPITGMGSLLSAVPGTPAHDLASTVMTIQANIGFDRLTQMRESSPTGGALGAISEREMAQLSAVMGNLEQSQSKEVFLYNLERVRETYLDIIHGPGNRPGKDAGQGGGARDISKMTIDELTGLDASSLTPEELVQANERFKKLTGQP